MDAKEPDVPTIEGIRARRMAPLGLVGSVSKSLFGLITEDDADLINKNIDKLFHDQSALVKISEEKTHILSAGLEELYNVTAGQGRLLKEMEGRLKEKINAMSQETNKNHLLWDLSTFGRQVESKLDHLIYSSREVLDILNTLMDRKLHARLLRKEALHQIAADIRQHEGDVELPIPPPHHLRAEELAKIATIDATYHDGKVLVSLTLPLTDRMPYKLYKLHPLAVPQTSNNHTYGVAYIIPKHDHIALAKDQQTYLPLRQHQVDACLQTHYGRICSTGGVLLATQGRCEIEMLLCPSRAALGLCDISLRKNLATQWSYLETDGTWVFAAAGEERIRISCFGDVYENTRVRGVGILRLAKGCTARTASGMLTSKNVKDSSTQYIYEPETGLNVTDLYPMFGENTTLDYVPVEGDTGPLSSWTAHKQSLKTVMERMEEIGRHERAGMSTRTLTYGNMTIQTLMVVGVIVFAGLRLRNFWRKTPAVVHPSVVPITPGYAPTLQSRDAPVSASRITLCPIQTAEID